MYNSNQKNVEDIPLPLITDYIVDSVYLPITESNHQTRRIKEVGRGKYAPREIVSFVRDRNHKLYFYDIDKGTYVDSMPLAKFKNEYSDFYPVGIDLYMWNKLTISSPGYSTRKRKHGM